eukprot:3067567-Prymnesium_polylepis.1
MSDRASEKVSTGNPKSCRSESGEEGHIYRGQRLPHVRERHVPQIHPHRRRSLLETTPRSLPHDRADVT